MTAWLDRVEVTLRENPPRRVSLTALARDAGVHCSHLARRFRDRHGQSIGRFLLQRRLEWAARQLEQTERSIVEIALASGFADQSHLTRWFRRELGVTPAEYRKGRIAG